MPDLYLMVEDDTPICVAEIRHWFQRKCGVSIRWFERVEGATFSRMPSVDAKILSDLRQYSALESIDLSWTTPSLESLQSLQELAGGHTKVTWINLEEATLTHAGYARLFSVRDVCTLILRGTNVADEDLQALPFAKELRELDLGNTGISDTSVDVLAAMPSLQSLCVSGTLISPVGLQRICSSNPQLKVTW